MRPYSILPHQRHAAPIAQQTTRSNTSLHKLGKSKQRNQHSSPQVGSISLSLTFAQKLRQLLSQILPSSASRLSWLTKHSPRVLPAYGRHSTLPCVLPSNSNRNARING